MNIESGFAARRLSEVADGSLLIAVIGRGEIIRVVKAFHAAEGGARGDFVVSVGPFVGEHGQRPIVYAGEDVLGGWVVDITASHRFAPSFAPDDLELKDAAAVQDKRLLGEVLFGGGTLMCVGNFGRAGPSDDTYLNLETSELGDLPDQASFLTTRRWRLVGPDAEGATGTLLDYTAKAG